MGKQKNFNTHSAYFEGMYKKAREEITEANKKYDTLMKKFNAQKRKIESLENRIQVQKRVIEELEYNGQLLPEERADIMIARRNIPIVLYRALDSVYDNTSERPEELVQFLSDINPYVWKDRKMVDPRIQREFNRTMDKLNIGVQVDKEEAYETATVFLEEQYTRYHNCFGGSERDISFSDLFKKVSIDSWKKLCAVVTEEEGF